MRHGQALKLFIFVLFLTALIGCAADTSKSTSEPSTLAETFTVMKGEVSAEEVQERGVAPKLSTPGLTAPQVLTPLQVTPAVPATQLSVRCLDLSR